MSKQDPRDIFGIGLWIEEVEGRKMLYRTDWPGKRVPVDEGSTTLRMWTKLLEMRDAQKNTQYRVGG